MPVWRRCTSAAALLFVLVGLSCPTSALAQTCTTSATPVSFGSVNLLSGASADTVGTLTVTCSGPPGPVFVCPGLSTGPSGGADTSTRYMTGSGGGLIRMNLFTDPSRSIIWTDVAAPITVVIPGTGGPVSTNVPIYGRVFGGQNTALAGTYLSNIMITAPYGVTACSGQVATGAFDVTALYTAACTLSATDLAFGAFGTFAGPVTATSTVNVACTTGSAYNVSLGLGLASTTTPTVTRRMQKAGQYLTYELHRDAARNDPWGIESAAGRVGTGNNQSLTVYGRIPVQTLPPPESYQDTVVVTVTN
jgi:spore coat protein U-like protein